MYSKNPICEDCKRMHCKKGCDCDCHTPNEKRLPLAKSILVVDDDVDLVDAVCEFIESLGHNSLKAKNGQEAISVYKKHHPDLVLMNHKIPGLNGIEASLKILDDDPDAKIILVNSQRMDKNDERLDRLITVIEKPFSVELLKSIFKKSI